ncbi:MAG: hypothetical protein ACFB0E_17820 [Leptolyngbyaceae cyanobacterium]
MHKQQAIALLSGCLLLGTAAPPLSEASQTEESIAYCELPGFAVNVYRDNSLANTAAGYQIRVFWREKAIVFVDQPADRTVIPEGYVYRNLPEDGNDDGILSEAEATWTLFLLNDDSLPCFLFKEGAFISQGQVTEREAPSPIEE